MIAGILHIRTGMEPIFRNADQIFGYLSLNTNEEIKEQVAVSVDDAGMLHV